MNFKFYKRRSNRIIEIASIVGDTNSEKEQFTITERVIIMIVVGVLQCFRYFDGNLLFYLNNASFSQNSVDKRNVDRCLSVRIECLTF